MRYRRPGSPGDYGGSGKCFNCSRPATAVWQGVEAAVEVCATCATAVLPALICDAVEVVPRRVVADHERHLARVHEVYWRAGIARLSSEVRQDEMVARAAEDADAILDRIAAEGRP